MTGPRAPSRSRRSCGRRPEGERHERPGEVGGLGADEPRHGVTLLALRHDDAHHGVLGQLRAGARLDAQHDALGPVSENCSFSSIAREAWPSALSAALPAAHDAGTTVMPPGPTVNHPGRRTTDDEEGGDQPPRPPPPGPAPLDGQSRGVADLRARRGQASRRAASADAPRRYAVRVVALRVTRACGWAGRGGIRRGWLSVAGRGKGRGGRDDGGGGGGAERGAAPVELGRGQVAAHVLQGAQEVAGAGEAVVGLEGRRPGDEVVEAGRHGRHDGRRRVDRAVHVLVGDLDRGVTGDGLATGEHLEEEQAGGVEVAALVGDAPLDLLGREVGHRAEQHAGLARRRLVGDGSGEPEVGHLDLAVAADDDVLWLDVAVDEAGRVGGAQRQQDRLEDRDRLARRQRRLLVDDVAQRLALDELHREEDVTVVLALVVYGDDVGVAEAGGRPGLAAEALDEDVVGRESGSHDLEGDVALEACVQRHVDRGHASVCEVREDAVSPVDDPTDEGVRHAGRHGRSLRCPDTHSLQARRVGGAQSRFRVGRRSP